MAKGLVRSSKPPKNPLCSTFICSQKLKNWKWIIDQSFVGVLLDENYDEVVKFTCDEKNRYTYQIQRSKITLFKGDFNQFRHFIEIEILNRKISLQY